MRRYNESAKIFFGGQCYCAVAQNSDSVRILGLYILHPNDVGRCAHIANADYAVISSSMGSGTCEMLVKNSLEQAGAKGFKVLLLNAVLKTNKTARSLFKKLGFVQLGTIPQGFLMKDGHYEDICPCYHLL